MSLFDHLPPPENPCPEYTEKIPNDVQLSKETERSVSIIPKTQVKDLSLIEENTQRTQKALDAHIERKIANTHSLNVQFQRKRENQVEYVRYTPSDGKTRIIRVLEESVDPMAPPKFKSQKLPAAKIEQVTILRDPKKSLTSEERKDFFIPESSSLWKNKRGYVAPLHQRVAAEGNSRTQIKVSDKFLKYSQALLEAEQESREEIEKRRKIQIELDRQKQEEEEKYFQEMAEAVQGKDLTDPEARKRQKEREAYRKQYLKEQYLSRRERQRIKEEQEADVDSELVGNIEGVSSGFSGNGDHQIWNRSFISKHHVNSDYNPRQQNLLASRKMTSFEKKETKESVDMFTTLGTERKRKSDAAPSMGYMAVNAGSSYGSDYKDKKRRKIEFEP